MIVFCVSVLCCALFRVQCAVNLVLLQFISFPFLEANSIMSLMGRNIFSSHFSMFCLEKCDRRFSDKITCYFHFHMDGFPSDCFCDLRFFRTLEWLAVSLPHCPIRTTCLSSNHISRHKCSRFFPIYCQYVISTLFATVRSSLICTTVNGYCAVNCCFFRWINILNWKS